MVIFEPKSFCAEKSASLKTSLVLVVFFAKKLVLLKNTGYLTLLGAWDTNSCFFKKLELFIPRASKQRTKNESFCNHVLFILLNATTNRNNTCRD
jgi:hypothetical protein